MDPLNPAYMHHEVVSEADFRGLVVKYLDPSVREEVTVEELRRLILAFNTFNLPLEIRKGYDTEFMNDCLRCLRNVVAGIKNNQTLLGEHLLNENGITKLISVIHDPQRTLGFSKKLEEDIVITYRLCFQVIANLITDHLENQKLLVQQAYIMTIMQSFLNPIVSDVKLKTIILHVLQNLARDIQILDPTNEHMTKELSIFIPILAQEYEANNDPGSQKCLETLLHSDVFLQHLSSEQRAAITEIIPFPPHLGVLKLLVSDFTFLTDTHLLTTG